jgi:hypothetical protein
MRASVQTEVYLEFIVFLLYSDVDINMKVWIPKVWEKFSYWSEKLALKEQLSLTGWMKAGV